MALLQDVSYVGTRPGAPGIVEEIRAFEKNLTTFLRGVAHVIKSRDPESVPLLKDSLASATKYTKDFERWKQTLDSDKDNLDPTTFGEITLWVSESQKKYCDILAQIGTVSEILEAKRRLGQREDSALKKRDQILFGVPFKSEGLGDLLLGKISVIKESIQTSLHVVAQERMEQKVAMAKRDPLTGLPNRDVLKEVMDLCDNQGANTPVCVIQIDADKFKLVNDTFGHAVGDEVLRVLANTISSSVRAIDPGFKDGERLKPGSGVPSIYSPQRVAEEGGGFRTGGEEFTGIVPGDLSVGRRVAERIRAAVEKTFSKGLNDPSGQHFDVKMTVSCGVACREPGSKEPLTKTQERADKASYLAKQTGRNRVCLAETRVQEPREQDSRS